MSPDDGVQLDFSKAQPINAPPPPPPTGGVQLDFTKAQPTTQPPAQQQQPPQQQPKDMWGRLHDSLQWEQQFLGEGTPMGGFYKEARKSAAFYVNMLRKFSDVASPDDAMDYKRQHPEANDEQALKAVQEQGYRAPNNRESQQHLKDTVNWLRENSDTHGFWEGLGGTGEVIAELLGPGVLSDLSKAPRVATAAEEAPGLIDQLKRSGNLARFLKDNPRVANVVAYGLRAMRAGAEMGGQAYEKTEDPQAAKRAALTGVIAAPLLELGGKSLAKGVEARTPNVGEIAGVRTIEPASLREEPPPQTTQGFQIAQKTAQQTTARNLEESNAMRRVPEGAPQLTANTGPYKFRIEGMKPEMLRPEGPQAPQVVPKEVGGKVVGGAQPPALYNAAGYGEPGGFQVTPQRTQYMMPGRPSEHILGAVGSSGEIIQHPGELITEDPNIMRGHIDNLNQVIDSPDFAKRPAAEQRAWLDHRQDAQKQMGDYYQHINEMYPGYGKPNFPEADIPKMVQKVDSWRDASEILRKNEQPIFSQLDNLTGNKFGQLQTAERNAWKAYLNATPESADNAAAHLDAVNQQMEALLDSVGHAVTPSELQGARTGYRNHLIVDQVANIMDDAVEGNPKLSARSLGYRGFNGQTAMRGLTKLTSRLGRDSVERVLGPGVLDNLYQMGELTSTNTGRAKVNEMFQNVAARLGAKVLVGETAGHLLFHAPYGFTTATGALTYYGYKALLGQVEKNPELGQYISQAIRKGTSPKVYVPAIASLLNAAGLNKTKPAQQPQEQPQP